jgi:hypothetical protein
MHYLRRLYFGISNVDCVIVQTENHSKVRVLNVDNKTIPASKQKEFYDAINAIRAYQKKALWGRCMHWTASCDNAPIASHLISESWLRKIADSANKVVRFEIVANNVAKNGAVIEARQRGVDEKPSVTFPGFCVKHDNELFRCLEQNDFSATSKQLLALTYRSVCRDACAKYQMVACHLPQALEMEAPPFVTEQAITEMNNCLRLLDWKQKLEDMLSGGPSEIESFVVEFSTRPSVLASVTCSFPMTFTGRKLDARYEWMTLSILPSGNSGFAVFTWNTRAPKNPSLFVKSFKKIRPELQPTALLYFVLEITENFFIDPSWWNGLLPSVQTVLLARHSRSFTSEHILPPSGSLLPKTPLVDWGYVRSSYVRKF